nr:immunoglobulin heavy chain junction region [Macaca mulatta]MOW92644.1 immunoglobulin heavy chain junction region [Macaca mulatta]
CARRTAGIYGLDSW